MCIHTLAYKPGATEAPGQRELLFELGGGLLQNVFLIFSFPSASVDRTSLCAAFYWSQRQQAERSVKFSSFCPSFPPFSIFLLACIGFIAFPSFPHARTVVFHSPLLFFLFISYLLLFHWFLPCFWPVSPFSLCLISSVLSNGSLGSFPHTVSLFPFLTLSIQPYVSFPCPISLPYRYTWAMKVLL